MERDSKDTPSTEGVAAQVLAEREAIQVRLAALERWSGPQARENRDGDNTPIGEVMEGVQESVIRDLDLATREVLAARLGVNTDHLRRRYPGGYALRASTSEPLMPFLRVSADGCRSKHGGVQCALWNRHS